MSELHDTARVWLNDVGLTVTSLTGLHAVKARMLVADLLAENERLQRLAKRIDAERSYAVGRSEAAEARLRELANAEPVTWAVYGSPAALTPMIPRPEMPS